MSNNMPSLFESLKYIRDTPSGISPEQRIGVKLPSFASSDYWLGNEDLPDVMVHATVYGEKTKNMLITDRVSAAEAWVLRKDSLTESVDSQYSPDDDTSLPDIEEPSEKDIARWGKVFNSNTNGLIPFLQLKEAKGIRSVSVPRAQSMLNPSEGNCYLLLINDIWKAYNYLKTTLHNGLYKITYKKVDGSTREIACTLNSNFLENYYATNKEQALGPQSQAPFSLAHVLSTAMIRVPDLEAPIAEGVFRTINMQEIKNIEQITPNDIDKSFINFDKAAFMNFLSQMNDLLAGYALPEDYLSMGLPEYDDAETIVEYSQRVLDHGSTGQKRVLVQSIQDMLSQQ